MTDSHSRPIPILLAQGFADRETPLIAGAPVSFAIEVLGAAGVPAHEPAEFRSMIAAEHHAGEHPR